MRPINLIGPAYQSRSPNYADARCINLYLEGGKGKAPALLIGTPGLTAPWVTLVGDGVRGMYVIDSDNAVIVCGANVYKVTPSAVATIIGYVTNDGKPVQIVGNGTNIIIVASESMYSLTLGGTTATLIRNTISGVDVLGDFFVATESGTNNYVWADAVTDVFDPLNIQATNAVNDVLVGVRVMNRTAYFFGSKSIEPWYESGGADLPFSRVDGGVFEIGCIAPNSIAQMDTIFWLGGDDKGVGGVWTVEGGRPRRISTPAIEYAINQWPDMADAESFTYSDEGHAFYVLSSESGNQTFVYDISTGEWHERAWLHPSGEFHRIRPRCHTYFAGKHLVGDWENGNVYQYSLDCYSDNGNPLVALRSCVTIDSALENARNMTFQLDMDTGVGLPSGQGSEPVAMLRYSRDGGMTWSNALWRTIGRIGEYSRRAIWHRVGGGRRMVFEIKISDPVRRCIVGAYIR